MSKEDNYSQMHREQGCTRFIHQRVCVQGTVTVTPDVRAGDIRSYCLGDPIIGGCNGELEENCNFAVGQNMYIQVPLTFTTTVDATSDGLVCHAPNPGRFPEA